MRPILLLILLSGTIDAALARTAAAVDLDMTKAIVVTPPQRTELEQQAVRLLIDEVEARSNIRWSTSPEWPNQGTPAIVVSSASSLKELKSPYIKYMANLGGSKSPEGFHIHFVKEMSAVFVVGNDPRGVLYGVGRLLRELRMLPSHVSVPADFNVHSAPVVPLRGHQLGYRPKTNSYDGWDVAQWEQYIRDLVVFGVNAVELIPPRSSACYNLGPPGEDVTTSHSSIPTHHRPPPTTKVGIAGTLDVATEWTIAPVL